MSWTAFVDRRGVIGISQSVPYGVLTLATDDSESILRSACEVLARHAYDGTTLLVPGVPEAESDGSAVDAVIAFQLQLFKRLGVPQS